MPNDAPILNERAQTLLKALVERYIADGQPVGSGKPGPVTRQIQKLYYQAIGAADWRRNQAEGRVGQERGVEAAQDRQHGL
jgi:hypothetical protein